MKTSGICLITNHNLKLTSGLFEEKQDKIEYWSKTEELTKNRSRKLHMNFVTKSESNYCLFLWMFRSPLSPLSNTFLKSFYKRVNTWPSCDIAQWNIDRKSDSYFPFHCCNVLFFRQRCVICSKNASLFWENLGTRGMWTQKRGRWIWNGGDWGGINGFSSTFFTFLIMFDLQLNAVSNT